MVTSMYRLGALSNRFAAAVLTAALLALVGAMPISAAEITLQAAPNSPFPVGTAPTTVTRADFNDDGKVDLAAQNSSSNNVSVALGNGDGTFQPKQDFAVGLTPTSVISADFNGDGMADLAVSNFGSNAGSVSVLLGQDTNGDGKGDGTFERKPDFAVGPTPTSVISADFNGDRMADLAVSNSNLDAIGIFLGQDADGDGKGDGTFRTNQVRPFSINPSCSGDLCTFENMADPNQIITTDFNGDAKADLATANLGRCGFLCSPGGVSVLLGNGDGTFQTPKVPMKGTPVPSITAVHLNTGTSVDFVAAEFNNHLVRVMSGNGNGTFSAGPQLTVGSNPSAITSADLDKDAKADDLAVSNFSSDNVSVLLDNDIGGFQAARNFAAGDGPIFVIGADFNADSFSDLAVANQNSNNVSVLLNSSAPPPSVPDTNIGSGPSDSVASASATFEFSSSEPGSTFECALDSTSAYNPCTSPKSYGGLSDGSHTFYVKSTNTAGTTDPTPATRTWTVDTTAPVGPTINGPPGASHRSGSFAISGDAEAGSTVELFEGTASRGTSRANTSGQWSINLTSVSDGPHSYTAKATDAAGNTSAESNPRLVVVDTSAPTLSGFYPANAAMGVPLTATVEAIFSEEMDQSTLTPNTFTLMEQGSTTPVAAAVRYDRATNKASLDPSSDLASNKTYTATIKGGSSGAKDLAGNALAQDYSWTFTTEGSDTTPPSTNAALSPNPNTAGWNKGDVTLTLSATDDGSGVKQIAYSVNGGEPNTVQQNSVQIPVTGEGVSTVSYFATDNAGNRESPGKTFTIKIDKSAPAAKAPLQSFVTPSTLGTSTVPVTLPWSATDNANGSGVARYVLQQSIDGGAYTNVALPSATTTTSTPSLTPSKTYRFRVQAEDKAGNASAWATGPSFRVDAYQESSPAIVDTGVWATSVLSGAYGGSVQYASALGRNATFTVPAGSKNVEWVSTKAPNRGRAQVWLDGVQQDANPSLAGVQPFELYSSSTQLRRVVFSKAVSPATSHNLQVRVLGQKSASSTGTRVDIDAFVRTS